MTETEAERIAAAIHELRPDWPRTSLLTFIRRNLISKPRRDALVALAWVAADAKTDRPARVLEAGPWWKAAAVEGGGTGLLQQRGPWCKNCYQGEAAPIHRSGDCDFTLWPAQAIARERREELLAQTRDAMAANPGPAAIDVAAQPEGPCGPDCIRGAGHTGYHLPPTETEGAAR